MTEATQHILISKSGEKWTAALEWTGESRKRLTPNGMLFLRFRFDFGAVLLDNYNTKLKHGRVDGESSKEIFFYEVNAQAARKIKKAEAVAQENELNTSTHENKRTNV